MKRQQPYTRPHPRLEEECLRSVMPTRGPARYQVQHILAVALCQQLTAKEMATCSKRNWIVLRMPRQMKLQHCLPARFLLQLVRQPPQTARTSGRLLHAFCTATSQSYVKHSDPFVSYLQRSLGSCTRTLTADPREPNTQQELEASLHHAAGVHPSSPRISARVKDGAACRLLSRVQGRVEPRLQACFKQTPAPER